jgi:hypothetical protein
MISKKNIFACFILTLVFFYPTSSFSQEPDTLIFTSDYFDKQDPTNITLEFNIKEFQRNKSKGNYHPVILKFKNDYGSEISRNMRLKARGVFRRKFCTTPPFWLNINNNDSSKVFLNGTKRFKIVTQCHDSKTYNSFVLREYLVYKILNLVTDYSFKTRLLKVSYIDIGRKNKLENYWAFIIESEEMLQERLDVIPIKLNRIQFNQVDSTETGIISLFQYMIGNTDFSIYGRHNIKVYKLLPRDKPELIPVPYDFDYSGFVDTHYSAPSEKVNIPNVRTRYYLGLCQSVDEYEKTIELFNNKKEEIYNLINSFEYLDVKERNELIDYLDDFYLSINKPDFIKKDLLKTCR